MTISIHVNYNSYQTTTFNDTTNSNKPLLARDIKDVNNVQEGITSNKIWKTAAAITGTVLLGMGGYTLVSWLAAGNKALSFASGTNAETALINNAISHDTSSMNPAWDQLHNMTEIKVNIVTSKNETFSNSLIFEPHRIFTVATNFRDSVRALLFNDYMKLKVAAGSEGIKSFFFHSIKGAISQGKEIAKSFNELIINNAKFSNFSPQEIDKMKKIVDRLTDETQHLKGFQDEIGKRMNKKSDFGPNTARKWHNYFQSSFNKIDEMVNALLAFKY